MGFFTMSTGQMANQDGNTSFEMGGNDPMPDNTTVVAAVSKIGWKKPSDFYDFDSIKAEWDVLEPKEYAGRKVFQTIKIFDGKDSVADKAKTMLAVMDTICGGKIMAKVAATGQAPDDNILAQALINRPMMLTLGLFDTKEAGKTGINWIKKVAPRVRGGSTAAPAQSAAPQASAETPAQRQARLRAERAAPAAAPQAQVEDDIDEEIPF